jgi:tryptophan halogenase
MNYAYHFDAGKFATLLAAHAQSLGVKRVIATVDRVELRDDGGIAAVVTRERGALSADLFIDCTRLPRAADRRGAGRGAQAVERRAVRRPRARLQVPVPAPPTRHPVVHDLHRARGRLDLGHRPAQARAASATSIRAAT